MGILERNKHSLVPTLVHLIKPPNNITQHKLTYIQIQTLTIVFCLPLWPTYTLKMQTIDLYDKNGGSNIEADNYVWVVLRLAGQEFRPLCVL